MSEIKGLNLQDLLDFWLGPPGQKTYFKPEEFNDYASFQTELGFL